MPASPRLSHMGIHVTDMAAMLDFYTRVMGLTVSDRGRGQKFPVELVFLTSDPTRHHQLVLAEGRPVDASFSTVNQMSFLVEDVAALRAVHDRALAAGVADMTPIDHGNALSIYFKDPEGNTVEVYLETDFYVPQPHRGVLDFGRPDEEILASNEAMVRADPAFLPRAAWEACMRERMSAAA
jgi:catechol 2,3-dioxygenase